jgi:dienelactone hydrolase
MVQQPLISGSTSKLNRRSFLLSSAAAASAWSAALPADARAAGQSYHAAYPDMLLAHVTKKLNAFAATWDAERSRIHTPEQIKKRNRFVREKFFEMIHGYPERTPLSTKVTAVSKREGYHVENVMFQSLPNFWVTGNLYVPLGGKAPYPAVISPCGHYPLSRMMPGYQCMYLDLVKVGFVVLAYDPVGQGERRQYWNPATGHTDVATASTYEHSMAGQLLLLMGDDLTHYRVWDSVRAIDYLQTRPEVDPQRIACAGHSGGGTVTLFVSALDDRIKCAVVSEGGTSSRWPKKIRPESRVGPSDVEQNYFPGAKYGIDHPDLHIAIAPRPLMALIEHYSPGLVEMDGNWAALLAASDGKVYAGLANHGGSGHLVYYDLKQDRVHDVGGLNELCGESHMRRGPQSKIHAKFGEGKDGRIYYGTHGGNWWDYARYGLKEGYPGAHWMAYDPKSGHVEDFGIGPRYEGINTGAYDPQFNRIYGLTNPRAHFVYYDVASKRTGDLRRIDNWESICRTLGIDDEGNVYGSFGEGQVFKYDPRKDAITELSVRVPIREKGISLGRDYLKSETAWRTVIWDKKTRRFYGIDESATNLFSFDPHARQGRRHRKAWPTLHSRIRRSARRALCHA